MQLKSVFIILNKVKLHPRFEKVYKSYFYIRNLIQKELRNEFHGCTLKTTCTLMCSHLLVKLKECSSHLFNTNSNIISSNLSLIFIRRRQLLTWVIFKIVFIKLSFKKKSHSKTSEQLSLLLCCWSNQHLQMCTSLNFIWVNQLINKLNKCNCWIKIHFH